MCRSTFRISQEFWTAGQCARRPRLASGTGLLSSASIQSNIVRISSRSERPLSLFLRLRVSVASSFQPRLRMNSSRSRSPPRQVCDPWQGTIPERPYHSIPPGPFSPVPHRVPEGNPRISYRILLRKAERIELIFQMAEHQLGSFDERGNKVR